MSTSLVQVTGITSSLNVGIEPQLLPSCPDGGWLKGVCKEHGTVRWVKMSCKRRTCPVCGQARRSLIALRVAEGIRILGGEDGAGWQVLTFDYAVPKAKAVRIANQFIQWLNRYMKRVFGLKGEWAKVWERHRSGRLHLNLVMSPWRFIPQALLASKWHSLGGGIVHWVHRVGETIGAETAKSRYGAGDYYISREDMGTYLAKLDQMVLTGRGVSYSKAWPKLPKVLSGLRRGEISWDFVGNFSIEGILHWYDLSLGAWVEVTAGEWRTSAVELCDCFEFRPSLAQIARRIMADFKNGARIRAGD